MKRVLLLCVVLLLAPSVAPAHNEPRRAEAHEHSTASAQLAVEAGRVDLMLQIPGANLVGFEHPPRDAAERERVNLARERLASGDWLILPEAARCAREIEIRLPGFGTDSSDAASVSHAHAEFRIVAAAECERARQLEWVELRLFDGWPDNRVIRIDAITESNQLRAELTADSPRIELQ